MKLALVLTNDWELFGDGSGEYFDLQHNPLIDLLKILDSYKAKITLMAEVCQQFAFNQLSYDYQEAAKISKEWESILKQVIKSNSDVQLHIHPQWLGYKYYNGKFSLNMNNWSIANLMYDSIYTLIKTGKDYLESFLNHANKLYKCIAFRAGAYCIQPSELVIKALKANDIICDTSVTQGYYSSGFYDFRKACSFLPYYTDSVDINKKGNAEKGIIEFPIYSFPGFDFPGLKMFIPKEYYHLKYWTDVPKDEMNWQKERDKIKALRYPTSQRFYKANEAKDIKWLISAIIKKASIQLDYDYIPATIFVKILKAAFKRNELKEYYDKDIFIPIIASGHIKDIHNWGNLTKIFELINKELPDQVEYWTLSQAVSYTIKNKVFGL